MREEFGGMIQGRNGGTTQLQKFIEFRNVCASALSRVTSFPIGKGEQKLAQITSSDN